MITDSPVGIGIQTAAAESAQIHPPTPTRAWGAEASQMIVESHSSLITPVPEWLERLL